MRTRLLWMIVSAAVLSPAGGVLPSAAQEIHIGKELIARIDKNPGAKEKFLGLLKTPDAVPANWNFTDVKIVKAKVAGLGFKLDMPEQKLEYITGTRVVNCRPLAASRTVNFSESVTNSMTMSNAQTFGYGVEASAEFSFGFGKAGAKVSTTGSFNKTAASTSSTTKSIAESITVSFPAERAGIVSGLFADRIDVKNIPYTGRFRPSDESEFEVTAESKPGRVCMRTEANFRGFGSCYHTNRGGASKRSDPNMKVFSVEFIDGRALAILWDQVGYKGNKREFHAAAPSLGDWAGRARSWEIREVPRVKVTRKLAFRDFKHLLSSDEQSFAINGTIDVNNTSVESKQIINYDMDPGDVKRICDQVSPPVARSTTPGGPAMRSAPDAKPGVSAQKLSPNEFKGILGKLKKK